MRHSSRIERQEKLAERTPCFNFPNMKVFSAETARFQQHNSERKRTSRGRNERRKMALSGSEFNLLKTRIMGVFTFPGPGESPGKASRDLSVPPLDPNYSQ